MTGFSLHQHQLNLIQQGSKYQSSIADYNMQKVIRYYKDAINSAQTSQEAKGLAQSLEGVLSSYGKGLSDVKGLNTNLLNAADGNAAGKAGHAKQKGSAYDKKVIADLSDEFGIDVKKSGTTKDWLAKAKQDENVRVLDKSGKDVTNEREGRIKNGDILEVNSKKQGLVRIAVGGDGEINGGDDKVLSVGGKAAAGNMLEGLNQVNNNVPQAQPQTQATANTGNIFDLGLNALNPTDPLQQAQNPQTQQSLFSENQIKSLIAAILNQSVYSIEQQEQNKYQQNLLSA
jgi:hypothetical protein